MHFYLVFLPAVALALMGAMSVAMWLMSTGIRKMIGLAIVGLLGYAWHVQSWELAAGALVISVLPIVFMGVVTGMVRVDMEIGEAVQYIVNLLIVMDLAINALLGGSPYETLSSVAHRMSQREDKRMEWRWRVAKRTIEAIFWFEPNHCEVAYESWLRRSQYNRNDQQQRTPT